MISDLWRLTWCVSERLYQDSGESKVDPVTAQSWRQTRKDTSQRFQAKLPKIHHVKMMVYLNWNNKESSIIIHHHLISNEQNPSLKSIRHGFKIKVVIFKHLWFSHGMKPDFRIAKSLVGGPEDQFRRAIVARANVGHLRRWNFGKTLGKAWENKGWNISWNQGLFF